jgi:hypothetical protein
VNIERIKELRDVVTGWEEMVDASEGWMEFECNKQEAGSFSDLLDLLSAEEERQARPVTKREFLDAHRSFAAPSCAISEIDDVVAEILEDSMVHKGRDILAGWLRENGMEVK